MATFTETTGHITVSVEPIPLTDESRPDESQFVFAYTVTIENHSEEIVQVMERHWLIESADQQIGEVIGPGVIGLQPTVEPGKAFQYTSSCVIRDPIGAMKGSYVLRRSEGDFFVVQIPRFRLMYPNSFN
jgi:ApaG protein